MALTSLWVQRCFSKTCHSRMGSTGLGGEEPEVKSLHEAVAVQSFQNTVIEGSSHRGAPQRLSQEHFQANNLRVVEQPELCEDFSSSSPDSHMLRAYCAPTGGFQFDLLLKLTGFGNGTGISIWVYHCRFYEIKVFLRKQQFYVASMCRSEGWGAEECSQV